DVNTIRSVALSADGAYAAAGYNDGQIRLYATEDGSPFQTFIDDSGSEDNRNITELEFSPDGQFLVASAFDGVARVWDWRTGTLARRFAGHVEEHEARGEEVPGLRDVSISADSQRVASGDDGLGLVMVWDIETGERLTLYEGGFGAAWAVELLPDATSILIGYEDSTMRWVDLETLTLRREFTGHTARVWNIDLVADGREALSASYDNIIIHWELSSGQILNQFKGHTGVIYGVAATDLRFVSGSRDGTLRYWDVASGAQIRHFLARDAITGLFADGEGEAITVIAGEYSGGIQILDHTLTPQRSITAQDDLLALDLSTAHDLLVTAAGEEETITTLAFVHRRKTQRRHARL
ncbi:WD40 repeat domain-containing protein, partial [bacterium]|nr:WD40 repeat domain-containing protein [bacterium]